MGVKNYNNCMLETVERIAWAEYGKKFSSLPKAVKKRIEKEAAISCDGTLDDNALHIWRKQHL